MLLKQHTVLSTICIIQFLYKIKMFSDRFMQILQSNFLIVSKSIIIKIQKIIILNSHSYQKKKKINSMLLKQHTVPQIICVIQFLYKINLFSHRFMSNFIFIFYNSIKIYNYKNTKNKYTQQSQLPKNKKINSTLLKQHTVLSIKSIIIKIQKINILNSHSYKKIKN